VGFAVALSRSEADERYIVDVYSAGNVAAFVSRIGNYGQFQTINRCEGRRNLYRDANVFDDSQVEHAQVYLNKGDLLVLCSDGVKQRTNGSLSWKLPIYQGGEALCDYCTSIIGSGSQVKTGNQRIPLVFDDRSVLGHKVI